MMEAMIKDVVMSFVGNYPGKKTRDAVASALSKSVFAGMSVTDITMPNEVYEQTLVYAVDMPNNGGQKILRIETANGMLDRGNIKINLQ